MVRRAMSLLTATILVVGVAIGLAAPPAGAAVGPGEDRQLSAPTGWWTYTGSTAAQVTTHINDNHARLTDIKVTGSGSSQRFTVTMVQNSGSYATGWLWYYNITPTQVVSLATDNTARATVVQCYNTASGVRCAAIMISNTGANAEGWAFYYGTAALIDSKVTSSNRLVSYGRIQGTSLYSAVFGSNTGTDATAWWYYRGVSSATISSKITSNHARLVDLDRNEDTGTYNAIMYANPAGTRWYWYTGYGSVGALVTKAMQNGARLFDLSPYTSGGRTTWSGVMVENLTTANQKIFGVMSPAIDSGTWGYSLQPLDGGSASSLQSGTVFEPASVLKTVYHYLSINRQESGLPNSTSVTYRLDPNNPGNVGICPDNYSTTATTTLANADTQMMQVSDNRMTRGIRELYGTSAVNAQIAALGMTNTAFHHNIGCPTATTHNETTLADLAKLYGAFDDATDITTTAWRNQFKNRMLNEDNTSYFSSMCPLVQQRATALGKPASTANAFCARISWMSKGGSYQYGGSLPATISYATSSMTELPFKTTGGAFAPRAYFWGDFVDGMTLNSTSEGTTLSNARSLAYRTAMTPFIDAALATW